MPSVAEPVTIPKPKYSAQDLARHQLMDLAGYFEHHLIGFPAGPWVVRRMI